MQQFLIMPYRGPAYLSHLLPLLPIDIALRGYYILYYAVEGGDDKEREEGEVRSPPITAAANGLKSSPPSLSPKASGIMENIVDSDVIRIGLSLTLPASTSASSIALPIALSWLV